MKREWTIRLAAWVVASLLVCPLIGAENLPRVSGPRDVAHRARLPMVFEPNRGQTDVRVQFLSRGRRYVLFLTPTEAVLALAGSQPREAVLRLKLVGANPAAILVGEEEQPGRSHYFLGNDRARWHTGIPHYSKVRIAGVYPGIDLVFYGTPENELEYDFVVSPGADPQAIVLAVEGTERTELDAAGDALLRLPAGEVRLRKPVVYQEREGARPLLAGAYRLDAHAHLHFEVGTYDRTRPLVIDPVLSYSTYWGGDHTDEVRGVAVDSSGNIYLTGLVNSSLNFPLGGPALDSTLGGQQDAFVSKLNNAGTTLIYSTYLGGSSPDSASSIAVDSSGNAYVTGITGSSDFPTTMGVVQGMPGGSADAFVTKLNSTGTALVYSTYLGGAGFDRGSGIAVDASDNAYITGSTTSTVFPTTMGAFDTSCGTDGTCNGGSNDAFVTKINAAGSALSYSTYLGGSDNDSGNAIAVDASGNAYVGGSSSSTNFPNDVIGSPPSAPNAFLTKVNAAGSALSYSFLIGGNGGDNGIGVAVDGAGSAYLAGFTSSTDFVTSMGAFQTACPNPCGEAFVLRMDTTGTAILYSTLLGSSGGDEQAQSIALDATGNAYLTGFTTSNNFPTMNPVQGSPGGGTDAFVAKLSANGSSLLYSTYLGGNDSDSGTAITVDAEGTAYVGGGTLSSNFWSVGAFQGTSASPGLNEGFLSKIKVAEPAINVGGIVNAASFNGAAGIAPGAIAAIFGLDLAQVPAFAGALPLPTTLGGATMEFNSSLAVPKFFASPNQVNVQVPWEVPSEALGTLTDTVDATTSAGRSVTVNPVSPGLFAINQQGTGQGAILIANTATFAAAVGSIPGATSRPAVRGMDFLEIYCTGLGPVTNQPASGAAASASPLSATTTTPTVIIGDVAATVLFSGLAPGFAGLYVVTLQVPANAPTGAAVPVQLTIGGVMSNVVTIAVE
ncbi:MAG TPA: SBBP repeat-containing protein [Candidatus Xenobia bacterium]|nr:SBBP repeat-containing protein [Candidatus Xenobia bacterium]